MATLKIVDNAAYADLSAEAASGNFTCALVRMVHGNTQLLKTEVMPLKQGARCCRNIELGSSGRIHFKTLVVVEFFENDFSEDPVLRLVFKLKGKEFVPVTEEEYIKLQGAYEEISPVRVAEWETV